MNGERTTGLDSADRLAAGKAAYRAGDLEAAARSFAEAAALDPQNAEAPFSLAVVLENLGRATEALEHYQRATTIDPGMAKAFVNWGNALRVRGDSEGAEQRYRHALDIEPADPHALNNLAGIAYERGDVRQAAALYQRAVDCGSAEARSGLAKAYTGMGKGLQRERHFDEAAAHYRRALELDPRLAMALSGLGSALVEMGQRERALSLYDEALAQDSRDFEALNNLACVALDSGNVAEAKRLFRRAVEAQPREAEPRYNLGLIALREHDFAAGWEAYELRTTTDAGTIGLGASPLPRLDRGNLAQAGRVAVRQEQGIGDQILFSTLLPELSERGIDAVVETDPRLVAAYRRSLPGLTFVSSDEPRTTEDCDHEIPMGSLARLFRPTGESFARQPRALLAPDPETVERLRGTLPVGPKVGISWRSFQKGRHWWICERKSAQLECFAPLALDAQLIDLQYGDVARERALFDAKHRGLRTEVAGLDLFGDVEGVLAAIDLCDLVVTTSNALAHFAGAIGKRTLLVYLAGQPPFHYWMPGPDGRSLWYPSVEIVSDPAWTTWEPAFAALAQRCRTALA